MIMAKIKKIKYTQVKSKIGSTARQKRTLEALGLKKISNTVEAESSPQLLGMLEKVRHLLKIEEIK
jgi:large subunit ribosomal protein L30